MAEIVAGIGVPHSPHYPAQIARDGPEPTARVYREIARHLDAVQPDTIVVIANDHFNTFFMNNFPTFAIGIADTTFGPNDQTKMPHYDLNVQSALARHLRNVCITEGVKTPVVPIWVNAFVAPLPTARRCYALGKTLRSAVETMPGKLRVAVLGSGSFSLEIGGPKINPGKRNSVPDIEWSKHIHRRLQNAQIDELVAEATPERMRQAGNIGGELLNWMVLLGAIGTHKPRYIADHDDKDGHAYAVWRWD